MYPNREVIRKISLVYGFITIMPFQMGLQVSLGFVAMLKDRPMSLFDLSIT